MVKAQAKVIQTFEQLHNSMRTSIENTKKKVSLFRKADKSEIVSYYEQMRPKMKRAGSSRNSLNSQGSSKSKSHR